MKLLKKLVRKYLRRKAKERGSALIIVTLLLALLTIYVSASLTITTTDTVSSNFEVAQQKAYYTAFSKLEQMSRDFSSLFINSTNPSYDSLCRVVLAPPDVLNNFRVVKPNVSCPPGSPCAPGYSSNDYSSSNLFDLGWVGQPNFCIVDVCNPSPSVAGCTVAARPPYPLQINTGVYTGLQAFIRRYRQVATVTNQVRGGADLQLTRDFDNLLLPLFQFGIFSDSDFELYVPPNWAFGGWVHTNNNFYLTRNRNQNIRFSQYFADANGNVSRGPARISVGKHMLIGNEKYSTNTNNDTLMLYDINTAGGTRDLEENEGSARTGARVPAPACNSIGSPSQDVGAGTCGPLNTQERPFINVGAPRLQLPIQTILNANPIQLIRRGLSSDFDPPRSSPYFSARYYYKPSIRVTLADYQSQLPRSVVPGDDVTNPTSATGPFGGIQLDAPDPLLAMTGTETVKASGFPTTNPNWFYMPDDTVAGISNRPLPRGYVPKVISPTDGVPRPTGARVNGYRVHGWIKVEVVRANGLTQDITQEILNLGLTVPYSANSTGAFYYPRATASFPSAAYKNGPLPFGTGPFPDENSILHIQRFGVPYTNAKSATLNDAMPADLTSANVPQGLNNLTNVIVDYYSSMARRAFNNPGGLNMFGIEDNLDGAGKYLTRNDTTGAAYHEPQVDRCGYYTDADTASPGPRTTLNRIPGRMQLPAKSDTLARQSIDFSGNANATTSNYVAPTATTQLTENANTPKKPYAPLMPGDLPDSTNVESVVFQDGETTWSVMDNQATPQKHRLVPFPINMFDSREGTPHEPNGGATADPPVRGLVRTAVTKVGTMNLVEIDMGNLGRLLKGDFDALFSQMGNTPFRQSTGNPLTAAQLRDNIDLNQDNGWLVYMSDRRGDEPVLNTNPNVKTPGAQLPTPTPGTPSLIGDGEYNREDVVWSDGGNTNGGNPAAIQVATSAAAMAAPFGCDPGLNSNNRDEGKSPQDANNDCFIARETTNSGFSETAPYTDGFYSGTLPPTAGNVTAEDQYDGATTYATQPNTTARMGNIIAMTQVGTNRFNQPAATGNAQWSRKPAPVYDTDVTRLRVEMFRRGTRLVNASNLFPTGPRIGVCNFPLGVNIISENPVYVLGNFNAPAAEVGDTGDAFPGITPTGGVMVPVITGTNAPTRPTYFNGNDFDTCGNNCHVPAAIVADAITLLSGVCVGSSNTNWSTTDNNAGWLDSRSFITPYQAIGYRPARNSVYRFALVSGFTPSWYPQYWNGVNGANSLTIHQGTNSSYSSGALNNFPRFLEDWGQNDDNPQFATYSGSLIRIYKSTQGNGAFKRVGGAGKTLGFTTAGEVDYVYRPPNRDWIFDTDFNNPCTLPPGSPFLQLVDFKGFQQSQVQRQKPN
ncbi:MAG: hypothetical protein HY819_01845 [Acidobacteria bacterium]|nr:hypothetical protein [Acidobacteriota bacterium]